MPDQEQLKTTLILIERCHTVLADLFPHEGAKVVGGSRNFIGTGLFVVLKKCIKDIQGELRKCSNSKSLNDIISLWNEIENLVIRIEKRGRHGNEELINDSAILLYFACGVSWNLLCEKSVDSPPHDNKYVRVEPIAPLMKICGREITNQMPVDLQILVGQILTEMKAYLR